MKRLIIAGIIASSLIAASNTPVHADPNPYNPFQPNPPWPGQMQNTWDIPGIYGGWTNDPIYCNPMVPGGQCGIYAPNPNG